MHEQWRTVPGFEGYEVSSCGRLRSRTKSGWRQLNGKKDRLGYKQFALVKGGKQSWFLAHRLIAAVFLPIPVVESGQFLTVNHKNRIKDDNHIENLELVTVADNHRHWRKTPLHSLATLNP